MEATAASSMHCVVSEIPHLGGFPLSCQCISLGSKLYVLGGVKDSFTQLASEEVYVLDLAGKRQWRQCASMSNPRQEFACGAVDGEVFVFGGSSGYEPVMESEVYSPEEDIWSFSRHSSEMRIKHRVIAMGKELLLYGGMTYTDTYWDWKERSVRDIRDFDFDEMRVGDNQLEEDHIAKAYFLEIFNTETVEWRDYDASECYSAFTDIASAGQGKLYMISSSNIHVHETYDELLCTKYRSISTGSVVPRGTAVVEPFVTTVVEDELLAILNWSDTKKVVPSHESCLVLSKGFSKKDGEMVWKRAPWSGKHKPIHMSDVMCSIQL